jgi:hypothetical protein
MVMEDGLVTTIDASNMPWGFGRQKVHYLPMLDQREGHMLCTDGARCN